MSPRTDEIHLSHAYCCLAILAPAYSDIGQCCLLSKGPKRCPGSIPGNLWMLPYVANSLMKLSFLRLTTWDGYARPYCMCPYKGSRWRPDRQDSDGAVRTDAHSASPGGGGGPGPRNAPPQAGRGLQWEHSPANDPANNPLRAAWGWSRTDFILLTSRIVKISLCSLKPSVKSVASCCGGTCSKQTQVVASPSCCYEMTIYRWLLLRLAFVHTTLSLYFPCYKTTVWLKTIK